MAKKSIMSSLGLKKSPVVRNIEYKLPEIFEDPGDWDQVIKLLFQENITNGILRKNGYVNLDEAFLKSKIRDVMEIRATYPDIKTPFCTRKAYLGQIELVNGLLRSRGEDMYLEGIENVMLYVLTFKNPDFIPQDLQKEINQMIAKVKRPLTIVEKDKLFEEYLENPDKYLPTLPVFCKAIPEIFDAMYGAVLQIINTVKTENGEKSYNLERKQFRISNDDLVVVLIGSSIWGKKGKQMLLDQVVYFTGEEDGEE